MHSHLAIKLEQFRQARHIHGGILKFAAAVLGVKLARLPIPRGLRLRLFRDLYRKKYPPGLNENEAELPLTAYSSLNAVFTRGIKPEYRPIPAETTQFLSPCDGTIQEVGRVVAGKILTLKGIEYTLSSLLPHLDPTPFEGGHFLIIFLSPINCHRVFSPQDGRLEQAIHIPGYRLLVHPPFQRAEYPVYTLNERMILRLTTALGTCLVIMVAGWGVGNITLPAAPEFRPRSGQSATRNWPESLNVHRGEWIATFELGSTVVLFTPPAANVAPLVASNEEVKYGQPVLAYPG
jgi:phosphatidylserine decarboxylase